MIAMRYSTERFLADTSEPRIGNERFEVVEKRLVRVDVDGSLLIKRGTVIAYHGDLKFTLEKVVQPERFQLRSGAIRSAFKREAVPLSQARGKGRLYLSDNSKFNQVLRLDGESVYIASSNLLAFEPSLEHEVLTVGGVGLLAGGILMVKLSGHGLVAFSVKGEPLTMRVTPSDPVSTDPTATIAWFGTLWPELKTDLELCSLVGHGGGQPVQMLFRGDGHVVVNARSRMDAIRTNLLKTLTSKLTGLFA